MSCLKVRSKEILYKEFNKEATGTPLILIHGYLDSCNTWNLIIPSIQHVRVITVTLPGWGDSSKEGEYSVPSYAEDIVEVMNVLSIEKAFLGGHSMGTLISTLIAGKYPDRVAGLILFGGAATMRPEYVVDPSDNTTFASIGKLLQSWSDKSKVDEDFLRSFQLDDLRSLKTSYSKKFNHLSDELMNGIMEETLKADVRAYRDAWQSMLDENHEELLPKINIPTLLVSGTQDFVFGDIDQQMLLHAIKGSIRILIEGAPHGVIWTHPNECADALNTFIESNK
mmetsp:Transcript_27115/g.46440  ORF Transcript_27115/g.46440 Transcript_27115/m.46440 type:complete len:282 (-) Transcript_27115:833-1678(-)